MARKRGWTPAKRRRARRKAEAALRERRRIITASRDRQDSAYAGMVPIAGYADQILKLPKRLPGRLHMKKGRNAVYKPLDEAMAYLGCQISGILRLNHIDRLLPEGMLAEALGLPQWMSENTEQRFLKRATEKTLKGMDGLTQRLVEDEGVQCSTGTIEVDGDVTGVPQRARKREGVESGYCGGKSRPCYQQPRITVNGLSWWTDLRRGGDGCMDLYGQTRETALRLAQKHSQREVIYRLDGYFTTKKHLREAVEAAESRKNLHFLLAIHDSRMKKGRWDELVAKAGEAWKRVNSTTEIKELGMIRPWGDEAPAVRAVAVRRQKRKPRRKGGRKKKRREWDLKYLIVTSASRKRMGNRTVFQRYHQRQWEEFSFKDGKQSLSMAKMPTQKLMANRMHVKMVALAQVMMQLFARMFLPHRGRYGPTCKTIREKVVAIGGKNQWKEKADSGTDLLRVPMGQALASEGYR